MEEETIEEIAGPLPPMQEAGPSCPACMGGAMLGHAYVIGRVEARFPTLAVEKEFAQASGRADAAGQTDQETFHAVLTERRYRYIARQLCWVLRVRGVETYLLQPRDPADLDLLIESIRPTPAPDDLDVVIGMRGPVAGPELCNGLMLPILLVDQIYSFSREALIRAIPRPDGIAEARFAPAAEEMFERILQLTDNAGASDEHRALNYLAMRYPAIYARTAEAYARNASLTAVEVRPSALAGARRIVEAVFAYTDRATDVTEKAFVRVDVTEEFPFLVSKLAPTFDR